MGHFFWAGILVGLLLTAAGILLQMFSLIGITPAQLVLCSGLGIVFGAFGSTATIQYKGVVTTGVAALTIALLLLVDYLVRDDLVIVSISGDVKGAQLELIGDTDHSYPGVSLRNAHEFTVVGRKGKIKKDHLALYITLPAEEAGSEPRERIFECIPKTPVQNSLGGESTLQWRFDDQQGQLFWSSGEWIANIGPCPGAQEASPAVAGTGWGVFLSTALAAEPAIERLVAELESPSSVERREARKQLAALGPEIVEPLLDKFDAKASYRIRLGVVVALAEMLRGHKSERTRISQTISDEDLRRLVEASGDYDRTIRIYASEFLFDLGDPRAVPIVFEQFGRASDNGKYNMLIVVKGAVPYLTTGERKKTFASLQSLRPTVGVRTQGLIDQIMRQEL